MRFRVEMWVDGKWYEYGTWSDRNKANEVAMEVRDMRDVPTRVEVVE